MTKTVKSPVMQRAKMHFQSKLSNVKVINVPEWGEGNKCDFYSKAINLKERQIIERNSKDDIELAVEIVIRKLEDNEGKNVFNRADKEDLMRNACPKVIARVAEQILGEDLEMDEIEKN